MSLRNLPWKPILLSSPIFFAFLCHAIALDRWWLAIPATFGLIYATFLSTRRTTTSRQWYVVIGAGLMIGLVFPASDVSAGPLPPAAAAALTGVAITLAIYGVYTSKTTVAWSAAWALVSISGKAEFDQNLRPALYAFLLAFLLAAALQSGIFRGRLRHWIVMSAFVATLGVSTLGVATLVDAVNRVFLDSVENFATNNQPITVSGIGNSLSLSAKSTVTPSMDPLLEVSEHTGYLRANVMNEFDGVQWTTSAELKARMDPQDFGEIRSEEQREIELFFLEELNKSVPSPSGTISSQENQISFQRGWILRGEPNGVSLSITMDRDEELPSERINEADFLGVPDELIVELGPIAEDLAAGVTTNRKRAERITEFFQREFVYSLSTDLSGPDHPLVTLVKEKRPAYCVYFASAMAVMLRTQNIPARVVTGYVPGEVNPLSGRVTIRGRDAHAWVEVWSPKEERFVAFDPTPSSSRQELMGHNESVGILTAIFGYVRSAMRRLWLLLRHQPTLGLSSLIMSPLFWIFSVLLAGFFAWRRFRRRPDRSEEKADSVAPWLVETYQLYLDALRKQGITPVESETDDEMLARIADLQQMPLAIAAKTFLDHYRAARFGNESPTTISNLKELAQLSFTSDEV